MCKEEDKSWVDTPKGKCWYDAEMARAEYMHHVWQNIIIPDEFLEKVDSIITEERMKRNKV